LKHYGRLSCQKSTRQCLSLAYHRLSVLTFQHCLALPNQITANIQAVLDTLASTSSLESFVPRVGHAARLFEPPKLNISSLPSDPLLSPPSYRQSLHNFIAAGVYVSPVLVVFRNSRSASFHPSHRHPSRLDMSHGMRFLQ
jgi:hypothetical protein